MGAVGGGLACDCALLPCQSYVSQGRSGSSLCVHGGAYESRFGGEVHRAQWTCWEGCASISQSCSIVVTPRLAFQRAEVWSRGGGRNGVPSSSDRGWMDSSEGGSEHGIGGSHTPKADKPIQGHGRGTDMTHDPTAQGRCPTECEPNNDKKENRVLGRGKANSCPSAQGRRPGKVDGLWQGDHGILRLTAQGWRPPQTKIHTRGRAKK